MSEERKKIWIDPFQTKLTNRIAAYLAVFSVVFVNLLFVWKLIAEGPVDPWRQFVETIYGNLPAFLVLLLLVPIVAWDTVRMSHRLVGPLVRFRRTIQDIADGELVRPIKLREEDYLTEMRDEFNRMLESLQKRGVPVMMPMDAKTEDEAQKQSA
jgi:methyl-accepting chemotaxis protein